MVSLNYDHPYVKQRFSPPGVFNTVTIKLASGKAITGLIKLGSEPAFGPPCGASEGIVPIAKMFGTPTATGGAISAFYQNKKITPSLLKFKHGDKLNLGSGKLDVKGVLTCFYTNFPLFKKMLDDFKASKGDQDTSEA